MMVLDQIDNRVVVDDIVSNRDHKQVNLSVVNCLIPIESLQQGSDHYMIYHSFPPSL